MQDILKAGDAAFRRFGMPAKILERMIRSMVKFSAFQSAKVSDAKALNVTKDVTKDVSIEVKILGLLKENASITTTEMARQLSVNRRTIQRGLEILKSKGTIERKGGKRYGYWEIWADAGTDRDTLFQDGNGRVGRLIALKECLRFGLIPFIIEDGKKMYYYRGLSEWEREKAT